MIRMPLIRFIVLLYPHFPSITSNEMGAVTHLPGKEKYFGQDHRIDLIIKKQEKIILFILLSCLKNSEIRTIPNMPVKTF